MTSESAYTVNRLPKKLIVILQNAESGIEANVIGSQGNIISYHGSVIGSQGGIIGYRDSIIGSQGSVIGFELTSFGMSTLRINVAI
jgi:hypothetical protein